MLELRKLSAGYPGHPVLEDITLTFPAGTVTVIAGPNGSGKSTLLKAIAGILPVSGSICWQGQPLTGLAPKALARKVAYLPQSRQVPEITAQRLVLHGRFPYLGYPRRYREADYAAVRAAMEQMDIEDLTDRTLPSLSGGQRQKVYIAMALAQDTPIILLDEPNTFLDIAHQLQLMRQAKALAQAGKTVVLVLHDLAMALEYADRLVVLDRGRVAVQGTAEQILSRNCLGSTFGIEVRRMLTPEGWKYYYAEGGGDPST